MRTQARLPAALGALHNFICNNDPGDVGDFDDDDEENLYNRGQPFTGELAEGVPTRVEREQASQRQDNIAKAMWAQYQQHQAAARRQ